MTLFNYGLAALGATATGNANSGTTVEQMIDGSDATRCTFSNLPGNQVVDIGAPQYITQVRFLGNIPNTPVLYYSVNGTDWLTFGNVGNFSGSKTVDVGGITARAFKLTCLTNSGNYLYTFAVEGPVEVPPPPIAAITEPVEAWLDGLEQYLVPTVQDWLDAH